MSATATRRALNDEPLTAVVFDLDGVLTRTAALHQAAWKELFDEFLSARPPSRGEDRRPFSARDYRDHVDGKPRFQGVRAFLDSRGIKLPEGGPGDPPETETVWSLGSRKNEIFREMVERHGVETDEAMVQLVRDLRGRGVAVGVATSSRNGALILARAGLEDLFDARVDGNDSAVLGLAGKPDPDIFLECARRLGGAAPARTAVFEDAASGVAAAKRGRFGLVVGVDRGENGVRLREAGADWVVRDSGELSARRLERMWGARGEALPNALAARDEVAATLRERRLAVFLDYDGTLTPIVDRPEDALLAAPMRQAVQALARVWPTHIVSGRALEDVRALVGIDGIGYAGSHGYDIVAADGARRQVAPELEPEIHAAAAALRDATAPIDGVLVEDKRFSISVHYRLTPEARVPEVERAVDAVVARRPLLAKSLGKKVFQVGPAMDWDKGKALLWFLEVAGLGDAFPIYLGDDATDEDAFAVLPGRGLGILVTEVPRPSGARFSLQDPEEVEVFLRRLAALGAAAGGDG